jgi:hypothetical protein
MWPEAATRVRARVAAHVCACGTEGGRPVAVRVRAPAAAWNGPTGHSQVQTRLVGVAAALARRRIQGGVPVRPSATSHPRVQLGVPARVSATRCLGVAAGPRVTASRGIAPAWRAIRPRVAVPARVTARTRATGRAGVISVARVTVPARVGGATVQARTTVQPRITRQARVTAVQPRITRQARVTAVQTVRTARFYRTALDRTLPPRRLIRRPSAYGTVPPVRTPVPAPLTAVVAIGAPAGVMGGSTVGAGVGVTSGNGPRPARVPGGLRTAVAHALLAPPWPPPLPSRNHSIMKHQRRPRYLVGEAGPTGFRQESACRAGVPATATGRPRRFPEREPR